MIIRLGQLFIFVLIVICLQSCASKADRIIQNLKADLEAGPVYFCDGYNYDFYLDQTDYDERQKLEFDNLLQECKFLMIKKNLSNQDLKDGFLENK